MKVFRGFHHPGIAPACALTIGNFDGVHRGHQAMLALLRGEAQQRSVPSCVLTFEPHPRDYFAGAAHKPELAPARVGTLRDKLTELERCGVDQTVVLPFDARLAALSPQAFIDQVLVQGLGARYVLVGDDFRFGAKRAGDYAMLDAAGVDKGFDVARMNSYEVHGLRVSSSAVRAALGEGRMADAARLLGHPYHISGHVVHGRKLGRELGFKTLNLRFAHWKPAASGIFAVLVHGLGEPPPGRPKAATAPEGLTTAAPSLPAQAGTGGRGAASRSAMSSEDTSVPSVGAYGQPLRGVANLGVRPSLDPDDVNGGRVLLETHCLDWPAALGAEGAYGKIIRVELLHKLHDELRYDGLDALTTGIAKDCDDARAFFASMHAETHRQTTRDRI